MPLRTRIRTLLTSRPSLSIQCMSRVQEITGAIRKLSPAEREELVAELPALLPELDGDAAWERLIRDARPRPALSALLDQAEAEYRRDPSACPETSDAEFERRS